MEIKEKIKKIKESRTPLSKRYFLKILYNISETRKWDSDSIVIYKHKKITIFEYDITVNQLYMNLNTYIKIKKYYDIEVGEEKSFLSIEQYVVDMIYEHFNFKNIKRNTGNTSMEDYYIEYTSMLNNNLFNSISGKCKKVHFFAILEN